MPVTVLVRSVAGAPPLTFDGARIVIGRSDGSDVRLPDPSVSLRHASLRAQGAEYAIVDEGSTNGTWVGGVKLAPNTPRLVKSGDLVRVGRVWVELVVGQAAPTPDLGLATRDLALALVRRAMDASGADVCARVRVAEGPDIGHELRLAEDGRAYVIGRAERCDLALADEDASREHAIVSRRGTRIAIRDLGSHNGVYLGETRIEPNKDIPWRGPTMARIGLSVLALDEPVGRALAELEALADEPVADADAPPPPPPPAAETPPAAPPPPSAPAAEAPIAKPPVASFVKPRPRRTWSPFDILVVSLAVLVIGVSLAGLVWVLR